MPYPMPSSVSYAEAFPVQRGRAGDLQLTTAIDTLHRLHALLQRYLTLEDPTAPFLPIVPIPLLTSATEHLCNYLTSTTHGTHPLHTPFTGLCPVCTDASSKQILLSRLPSLSNISVRRADGSFYPHIDLLILTLANTRPSAPPLPTIHRDIMTANYIRFIASETGHTDTHLSRLQPDHLHAEAARAFATRITRICSPPPHPTPPSLYPSPALPVLPAWNPYTYLYTSPVTPAPTTPWTQPPAPLYYSAPTYPADPPPPHPFMLPRSMRE